MCLFQQTKKMKIATARGESLKFKIGNNILFLEYTDFLEPIKMAININSIELIINLSCICLYLKGGNHIDIELHDKNTRNKLYDKLSNALAVGFTQNA